MKSSNISDAEKSDGHYRWILVLCLMPVCILNYADRQAIFSIFPLLRVELALNHLQLGAIASSFMWVYAAAGPLAGWVSDRVQPRKVILYAIAFWSFTTAGTAVCHGWRLLVLFRALSGLGEAFYFPAAVAMIAAWHRGATRSRALALHQTGVYIGTIAGGTFAASIAERQGWRSGFLWLGIIGLLLATALIFVLRNIRLAKAPAESYPLQNFFAGVADVVRLPRAITTMAIFIGANFVAVIFLTWLPTYLVDHFGLSLGKAGFSSTFYLQIASVAGVLAGGVLADLCAKRSRGGRQWVQAAGLLGGMPFLFVIGTAASMRPFVLGMLGFGVFKGVYDANLWASLYDVVPVEHRGVAMGLMNSLGWLGGGSAAVLAGAASERWGLAACLSATSAIYLVLAIAMGILAYSMRSAPAPEVVRET